MRKSDRLFQMTNLIRSRQPLFAKTLAEEMGVSLRTVYRYVDDLSAAGIPIYYDDGQGYRLLEGFDMPPLSVTQDEFDALVTGVKLVRSWTGARLSEAATSLLHKMEVAVKGRPLDRLFDNVISPVLKERSMEAGHWDAAREAIRENQALRIEYGDEQGRVTGRVIYPLNLSFWGNKWTLGAWCCLRKAYRDFRLDRLASLEVEDTAPPRPLDITLNAYLTAVTKKKDPAKIS